MPSTVSVKEYAEQFAYHSNGQPEYVGWAFPGASTAEPYWGIVKFTFNSNDQTIKKEYANGDKEEINVWDDRVSLDYS